VTTLMYPVHYLVKYVVMSRNQNAEQNRDMERLQNL